MYMLLLVALRVSTALASYLLEPWPTQGINLTGQADNIAAANQKERLLVLGASPLLHKF
jgi:hypothetical protein